MKSNYKHLGPYIRQVDIRNKDDKKDNLLGVSVSKDFIESIANTVGTNFKRYKIVKKGQFTYIPDTSRRGDKIAVALLEDKEQGLVSQAYTVFEVKDTKRLLPEYLMMWFRRPEFDRYARFMSHGSVREVFSWEDMCEVRLPIPSITRQKEIVQEYQILQDKINLNNKLIQRIEEIALTLYKQWFVDFEFMDTNGNPYKSSGGEMEYNEVLEYEIPKGWKVMSLKEFCLDIKSGGTPSRDNPNYWNSNDIPWLKTGEIYNNILINAEEYISSEGLQMSSAKLLPKDTVLMSMYGVNAGDVGILKFESTTNQACCGMLCQNPSESAFLYYHLLYNQDYFARQAIGGAQQNLSKGFIEDIKIVIPVDKSFTKDIFRKVINYKEFLTRESALINTLQDLLLSKLTTVEDDL